MKKNIGFFISSLAIGGAEKQVVHVANYISNFHNVFNICLYKAKIFWNAGHCYNQYNCGYNLFYFIILLF